jgi:hypothetical protein
LSRNLADDYRADVNTAGFTKEETTEAAEDIVGRSGSLAAFIATPMQRARAQTLRRIFFIS